ncbi:protein kinase [Bacillus sp. FJAT-50079]|nr:protein kinase [Bacillus sp. FJAT-50079]
MINHSWKNQCNLPSGTIVQGKWNKQNYQIMRKLGEGANGVVYLANSKRGYVALKISNDSFSIMSEVNVLKELAKVQGSVLGPSLFDVDDWGRYGIHYYYYVMEYIHGSDLLSFIQQKGHSWAVVMIAQLLDVLDKLHQEGWIFGDIKPENLIVTKSPATIRCIDVGGTTKTGRAIKEFTEFYDRGYWGLGSRKAEPAYDLFSVALLMIHLFYQRRFTKKEAGHKQLVDIVQSHSELRKYEWPLRRALGGEYESAQVMRTELLAAARGEQRVQKTSINKSNILETSMMIFVTIMIYIVYIVQSLSL